MAEGKLPAGRSVSKRAAEIRHGTPGGYRKGCRCRKCTRAKSSQRAEERARKRARDAAAAARTEDAPPTHAPAADLAPLDGDAAPLADDPAEPGRAVAGQVEAAVAAELELHEGSAGVAPLAAVARALAREIDEAAGNSVAGAARQLVATLSEIRRLSAKTDEELAKLLAAMGRG